MITPKAKGRARPSSRTASRFSQLDTTPTSRDLQSKSTVADDDNIDRPTALPSPTKAMDIAFDFPSTFDDEGIDDEAMLDAGERQPAAGVPVPLNGILSDIESCVRPSSPIYNTHGMAEHWDFGSVSNEHSLGATLPHTMPIPESNSVPKTPNLDIAPDLSETASTGRRSSPVGGVSDVGVGMWDLEIDTSDNDVQTLLNSTLNRGNNNLSGAEHTAISITTDNLANCNNQNIPLDQTNKAKPKVAAKKPARAKQKAKSPLKFDEETQKIKTSYFSNNPTTNKPPGANSTKTVSSRQATRKSTAKRRGQITTKAKSVAVEKTVMPSDRVTRSQRAKDCMPTAASTPDKPLAVTSDSPPPSAQPIVAGNHESDESLSNGGTPQSYSSTSTASSPLTVPDRSVIAKQLLTAARGVSQESECHQSPESKSVIPCSEMDSPERIHADEDVSNAMQTSIGTAEEDIGQESLRNASPSISLGQGRSLTRSSLNPAMPRVVDDCITISSEASMCSDSDKSDNRNTRPAFHNQQPQLQQTGMAPGARVRSDTRRAKPSTVHSRLKTSKTLHTRIKSLPVPTSQDTMTHRDEPTSKVALEEELHWASEVRRHQRAL